MSDYSKIRKDWHLVIRYNQDYPDLNNRELAEKIIEDEDLTVKVSHFASVVGACRNALKEGVIDETYDDTKPIAPRWEVHAGNYIIHAKKGDIIMSVEEIDKMFYQFSKHGLDLTSTRVMRLNRLQPWEWHAIKSALRMYKESNIISPWTVENTPKEELRDMVDVKMSEKMEDGDWMIVDSYDKAKRRDINKVIRERHEKRFTFDTMMVELLETLPDIPAPRLRVVEPVYTTQEEADDMYDEILVSIADLHIGAKVRDLIATKDFDSSIVRDRLDEMARVINKYNANKVHLAFIGDLIESFTGLSHKNSWKSMEYGMYGAAVIKQAIEIIEEFVSKVNNVAGMYCIGGNHDRATSSWQEDDMGDIANTIWYFFERFYGKAFPVKFHPLVINVEMNGANYMLTHGDKKAVTRDTSQFVLEYGRHGMYNVILSGHLHTRMIPQDNRRYRWILSPSIFSGNWYSESNGWTAAPGFLVIRTDSGSRMPVVSDYPLE